MAMFNFGKKKEEAPCCCTGSCDAETMAMAEQAKVQGASVCSIRRNDQTRTGCRR